MGPVDAEIDCGRGCEPICHGVGSQHVERREQSSVSGRGPEHLLRYHGGVGWGPCLRQGERAQAAAAGAAEAPAMEQSRIHQEKP